MARGGGVIPYKSLRVTCGPPGYFFRDFFSKQRVDFINFCLKQGIFSWTINSLCVLRTKPQLIFFFWSWLNVLNGHQNSVLNRVGKSAIFVLNRVQGMRGHTSLPKDIFSTPPPPPPFPGTGDRLLIRSGGLECLLYT